VFARIALRSIGFGMSVWQHATEYLMCSIFNLKIYRLSTAPIDGTAEVTIRVLYFSRYLRRSSVNG
jgi:hypothetical protein